MGKDTHKTALFFIMENLCVLALDFTIELHGRVKKCLPFISLSFIGPLVFRYRTSL